VLPVTVVIDRFGKSTIIHKVDEKLNFRRTKDGL